MANVTIGRSRYYGSNLDCILEKRKGEALVVAIRLFVVAYVLETFPQRRLCRTPVVTIFLLGWSLGAAPGGSHIPIVIMSHFAAQIFVKIQKNCKNATNIARHFEEDQV